MDSSVVESAQSRFRHRVSVTSSSSIMHKSSHLSGSRQTNSSIDEVSVLEARIGDLMKFFHISNPPNWFVFVNSIALAIFVLQALSTVFPAAPTAVGKKYFWEDSVATGLFAFTALRTLMTYSIPMFIQYWITPIVLFVELFGAVLVFVSFQFNQRGNFSQANRLRVLVYIFAFFNFLFLLPLAYNITGWSNCQWTLFGESDSIPVLKRTMFDENPLPCWDFGNSFTGFMAILSFVVVSTAVGCHPSLQLNFDLLFFSSQV